MLETRMPFLKALKATGKDFKCTDKCKQAWMELCEYLEQILLLNLPKLGETLYMHLVASNLVIALVLIREDNNK